MALEILCDEEVFRKDIKLSMDHSSESEVDEGSWESSEYNYRLNTCDTKIYAVEDGVVIGHLGLQDNTVRALFVDEEHRGQGISKQLYLYAFKLLEHVFSDDAREESATHIWESLKEEMPDKIRYNRKKDQFEFDSEGFE